MRGKRSIVRRTQPPLPPALSGGAAVNGIVGGVTGAAEGIKRGISSGSHSTPAAALALGALGVAGLVEWPVLLAVGGGALLLRRLGQKAGPRRKPISSRCPTSRRWQKKLRRRKSAAKSPAKKATGRRAGATELRSTN